MQQNRWSRRLSSNGAVMLTIAAAMLMYELIITADFSRLWNPFSDDAVCTAT